MNIDLAVSWLVGDSTRDMLAARRAGLRSILVESGEAGRDGRYAVRPDFTERDLLAAALLITRTYPVLAAEVAPLVGRVSLGALVLVGGLAKQGKSTFASILRHKLLDAGLAAEVISLDGYLRGLDARGSGVEGRYNLDTALRTLQPWLAESAVCEIDVPLYDRVRQGLFQQTQRLRLERQTVLILEGVPALLLRPVTARPVIRVFLDAPEADQRRRVVDDLVRRGMDPAEAAATYAARQQDEAPFVMDSAVLADVHLSPMTGVHTEAHKDNAR
jgi:uridine kinase